jgi:hypothetical protein
MPRRNWFSKVTKDGYGLNFYGFTKKGKSSKKMNAKVYRSGSIGAQVPEHGGGGTFWRGSFSSLGQSKRGKK